jgi:hypothetical protein
MAAQGSPARRRDARCRARASPGAQHVARIGEARRATGANRIMIVTIAGYLWFVNRGRRDRDVSVL